MDLPILHYSSPADIFHIWRLDTRKPALQACALTIQLLLVPETTSSIRLELLTQSKGDFSKTETASRKLNKHVTIRMSYCIALVGTDSISVFTVKTLFYPIKRVPVLDSNHL